MKALKGRRGPKQFNPPRLVKVERLPDAQVSALMKKNPGLDGRAIAHLQNEGIRKEVLARKGEPLAPTEVAKVLQLRPAKARRKSNRVARKNVDQMVGVYEPLKKGGMRLKELRKAEPTETIITAYKRRHERALRFVKRWSDEAMVTGMIVLTLTAQYEEQQQQKQRSG